MPEAKSVVVEELECNVLDVKGRRTSRYFSLRDLEALCKRVRAHGGKPGTVVEVMRDNTGNVRLVTRIKK